MKRFAIAAGGGMLAGVLLATQVAGPLVAQEAAGGTSVYEQLDLFGDVFERIRNQYVEEVDPAKLIEAAINGMLTSLDPHSGYLPPRAYDEMRTNTRGEFGGLGIEVTQEEGFVKVIAPMDGTPAAKAGIEAGDIITHADGETLLGLTLDQQVELMRGPVGAEIVLTVVRSGTPEPFDVSIIRETIRMTAVRSRKEGDTVVLRITTFSAQTYENLREGIDRAVTEAGGLDKVNGFVIDLRNNPGGVFEQAVLVADAFLEQGEIVSTRSRIPGRGERHDATKGDLTGGKPLVVLINSGSASASEIVAAALQDHHRAIVVGTRSFGKGTVQSVMPLRGDGAIRLTTARYYTPSGRSIQAFGVSPDIIVQQPAPQDPEAAEAAAARIRSEADLRGSLTNDSLTAEEREHLEAEQLKAEETARLRLEDYQLAYAIDILKGYSALGGNGN
ncbi:MAG: S41 family peptidase [Rhodobacteraceae bacterium]|nr:S41 family peptidase [Paracoccaceae bacterium]